MTLTRVKRKEGKTEQRGNKSLFIIDQMNACVEFDVEENIQ